MSALSVRFFLGLGSTSSGSLLIDRFLPCCSTTNLKSVSPFGNCSVKKAYYVSSRGGKKDLKIVLIFFRIDSRRIDSMVVLTHHHFASFHSFPNKSHALSLSLGTKKVKRSQANLIT